MWWDLGPFKELEVVGPLKVDSFKSYPPLPLGISDGRHTLVNIREQRRLFDTRETSDPNETNYL